MGVNFFIALLRSDAEGQIVMYPQASSIWSV